ncbi:arginine decarboxylase, pyruvoyl-dependent [bacterium]|nr:arginine decarboxylase, pyruvoyl-dependent [bacterium]
MIIKTPTCFFLVSGEGEGKTPLNAFDMALLNSGIGDTNLVRMSSIVPPACKKMKPINLPFGALVPVAYASISSDIPGEIISAAVAVAIPENDSKPGLIMEYSARGHREDIENIVRRMSEEGMSSRGEKIRKITSKSVEHKVKKIGNAFAAVVLWDNGEI